MITAQVQFRPTFVCSSCGKQEEGDVIRRTVNAADSNELARAIDKINKSQPHAMPVGWASFYAPEQTLYRCPSCVEALA